MEVEEGAMALWELIAGSCSWLQLFGKTFCTADSACNVLYGQQQVEVRWVKSPAIAVLGVGKKHQSAEGHQWNSAVSLLNIPFKMNG